MADDADCWADAAEAATSAANARYTTRRSLLNILPSFAAAERPRSVSD
jgi:hypothetical protein